MALLPAGGGGYLQVKNTCARTENVGGRDGGLICKGGKGAYMQDATVLQTSNRHCSTAELP